MIANPFLIGIIIIIIAIVLSLSSHHRESFVDATDYAKVFASKHSDDYYGQNYFRADTTRVEEPVLDPLFNLRMVVDELLKLENDLREKQCLDCVGKHLTNALAWTNDAIKLCENAIKPFLCAVRQNLLEIGKMDSVPLLIQKIYQLRKRIGEKAFSNWA